MSKNNTIQKGALGNTIRTARLNKKYSQEQLAELVGITPTHLKHIESGHRNPSIEVLFHLVLELNFSLDKLLFESDSNTNNELYDQCIFLLKQCNHNQLSVILATLNALIKLN